MNSNEKWSLFNPSDKVVFALSGGKDSLSLLSLLSDYFDDFLCVHVAISSESDRKFIKFAEKFTNVHIIETSILEEARNSKKGACYICSRRRNQKIYEFAYENGYNRVLIGHNREDVTETLLMNMIYSSKISTMLPTQPLFGGKITEIRPLYEVPEILLKNYAKEFPVIDKTCEFDGNTKREYIKKLIDKVALEHKRTINVKDNVFRSILNISHMPQDKE